MMKRKFYSLLTTTMIISLLFSSTVFAKNDNGHGNKKSNDTEVTEELDVPVTEEISVEEITEEIVEEQSEDILNTETETIPETVPEVVPEPVPEVIPEVPMEEPEEEIVALEDDFQAEFEAPVSSNSFKNGIGVVSIDGNYSDWDSLPASYEYNWDNSQSCWYHGEWYNGVCYKTPEGTYDTNVRHKIQMYCDGTYVYLHIKFARIYQPGITTASYRFLIDGQPAMYQLDTMDGSNIWSVSALNPGTYQLKVRHGDGAVSWTEETDARCYLTVYDDHVMSDLEMMIPLSSMKVQNPNISLNNVGTVEFENPNITYRKVAYVGTSTGPIVYAGLAMAGFGIGFFVGKRRKGAKAE